MRLLFVYTNFSRSFPLLQALKRSLERKKISFHTTRPRIKALTNVHSDLFLIEVYAALVFLKRKKNRFLCAGVKFSPHEFVAALMPC